MGNRWISILAGIGTTAIIIACVGVLPGNWSHRVPGPFGGIDAQLQMGLLEWNARHLGDPAGWTDLPIFYPVPGAIGLMDPLLGQTLMVAPLRWLLRPTLAAQYNFAYLGSLLLAVAGMSFFWRASSGRWAAAPIAALALIATPYTISQTGHLNQLPPPFVLFALAGLVTALRRQGGRRPYALYLWWTSLALVIQGAWSWQGFAYATLAVAVFSVTWLVYWIRLRQPTWGILGPVLLRSVAPALLAATGVLLLAQPQLDLEKRYDDFTRSRGEVRAGSADLQHFFERGVYTAHSEDWAGRGPTGADRYQGKPRQAMSPAWFAVLLAAAGWWYRGFLSSDQRRIGRALTILGLLGLVLAFGDSIGIPFTTRRLPLPFEFLREIAPPFKAFRTVWRFSWLATVAVAWWAAVGADQILKQYRGNRWAKGLVASLLVLTALYSWPAGIPAVAVEWDGRVVANPVDGPVLSLPAPWHEYEEDRIEGAWLLRALEVGQPFTGGATGWVPPQVSRLRQRLHACEAGRESPRALFAAMQVRGIRYAELALRPGDDQRIDFWRKALREYGAVPIQAAPRPGYQTYRLGPTAAQGAD